MMTFRPEDMSIGVDLVRRLLGAHAPRWADLPLIECHPPGTQNAMFRLGTELCVRLPRRPRAAARLEKELRWLPLIGEHSGGLAVPVPVVGVEPSAEFAMPWAIYRFIEGERFTLEGIADRRQAALCLASFLTALRDIDPAGAPASQLDSSLVARDEEVRSAIGLLGGVAFVGRATAAWERCLAAPPPTAPKGWTHGDLLSTNLLVQRGRLAAVVDFGYAGIGDPALDLLPAWSALDAEGRDVFRRALDVDDATWLRARGFALHTIMTIAAEHSRRNGPMRELGIRMTEAALSDC
jgi:aminoglycoside phosphotransferase (APT) family kinase protein